MFKTLKAINDFAAEHIQQCMDDLNRLRELRNQLMTGISSAAEDYNSRNSALAHTRDKLLEEKEDATDRGSDSDADLSEIETPNLCGATLRQTADAKAQPR